MFTLLKKLYDKAETLKGRRLFFIIGSLFVLFIFIGFAVGYAIIPLLNKDEIPKAESSIVIPEKTPVYYEGKITYVNPAFYPEDQISYSLVDSSGKEIILLKSEDQKLSIAEGLFAKVTGTKTKTKDGKTDVLNVREVIIKSVAN